MIQSSIWEQLLIFFDILTNNLYMGIVLIVSSLLLLVLIITNKFKNKKITKIVWILLYVALFGTLTYFYHKEILQLLDYLIENIVLFLFFPNLAVYMLVLIIINIIIIRTVFSEKVSRFTRNVNIICFLLFTILFYLIVQNIIDNQINVYEQLSIYTNNELLVLVELSMELFIFWLLILLIIKVTVNLSNYTSLRKGINYNLVLENSINEEELEKINSTEDYMEIKPVAEIINFKPQKEYIRREFTVSEEVFPIKKKEKNLNQEDENADLNQISMKKAMSTYENLFDNCESDVYQNDYSMEQVFSNSDNYLKNIAVEIQNLKKDTSDKNRIKTIYEQVVLHEKDLTLKDYNYLIDMLVNIKK